jgi:hypothetical protein
MSQKAFVAASSLIPDVERMENQLFTMVKGNLFFMSSTGKSWFIIRNFAETNEIFTLTHKDIQVILAMGTHLKVEKMDNYVVNFVGANQNLTMGTSILSAAPEFPDVSKLNFREVDELIVQGRHLFTLWDGASPIGVTTVEDKRAMVCVNPTRFVCLYGCDFPEMDLSSVFPHLKAAGPRKIKTAFDGTFLVSTTTIDECEIISGTMVPRRSISSLDSRRIMQVLSRWDDGDDITIRIQSPDIRPVVNTINRLGHRGLVTYEVTETQMTITCADSLMRNYTATIPCVSSGKVVYRSMIIDPPVLDFFAGFHPKQADFPFVLVVDWRNGTVVMRTIVDHARPFIMTKAIIRG